MESKDFLRMRNLNSKLQLEKMEFEKENIELKKMYRELKIDNLRLSEINTGLKANIELYKNALMFEPLKTWADDYIDNGADEFVECMSEIERDFAREFINQLCEYVKEVSDPIEEIEEKN